MNIDELTNHNAWGNADLLVELMKEWSDNYYNDGSSPVVDHVYDESKKRLEILDSHHPYLSVVGARVRSDGMVRHKIPMGSLNNLNNEQELKDWWGKIQPREVVIQYKFDGLSVNLEYENGKLVRGLSRGDGIHGEELIDNVKRCYHANQINSLNGDLTGSIRGEGIIYKEDFNDNNFPGESNPRNSAVGAIRKSNSQRVQWVRIACYDFANGKQFDTEVEKLEYMKQLGLPVCGYVKFTSVEEVINYYDETVDGRDSLGFAVDGLVIKINSIVHQDRLGSHKGRPKYSMALKFPCMTGTSIIKKINLTVGHQGQIIPTAEYDPIMIDGRTFRHVLLDNFNTIEKYNIAINDMIEIEIAGDIIPRLKRVIKKGDNQPFKRPTNCPICGSETFVDGALTKCSNDDCSAKSIGKINNWVKKTGIKFFGSSRQEACFESNLITKLSDLYTVTEEELGGVIGIGNAKYVVNEINNHRSIQLAMFVGSLGIKFLGRSNAKKLIIAGIDTLDRFLTFDPIIEKDKIDGFGDNLIEISNGLIGCSKTINDLMEAGVDIIEPMSTNTPTDQSLKFCFTGIRLKDLQDAFDNKGWEEKRGVSDKLDFLVTKDPMSTSGKTKKARDLGVNIIGFEEFKAMLEG